MPALIPRIKDMCVRLARPPVFPERERGQAAESLNAVLLTVVFLFALTLLLGNLFLFSNMLLANAVCLLIIASGAWCRALMHRGYVRQAGMLLIGPLWLSVGFVTAFSPSVNVVPHISLMLIAYLLYGPWLALAVLGTAIPIVAGPFLAEPLGFYWPEPLFHPSPLMLLYLNLLFVVLGIAPFVQFNRQLQCAVRHLERFRSVQRDLGVVTWIWEQGERATQWDGDLSPLLGLSPGVFSGNFDDYERRLHPDDRPMARRRFIDSLKGIHPAYQAEERVIWPDGGVHWLQVAGDTTYGADGRATRMTGTVTDITERRRNELALASTEERFTQTFYHSPIAICISRLSGGQILDVNPAFEQIFGYSKDELIGRTGIERDLWSDPADRDAWFGEMTAHGMIADVPMQFRTKSGIAISTRLSGSIIDLSGEKIIISLVRDVTAQERAERAILESEQKYAAVFETCPEAIAVSRVSDGVMLEANEAWTQYTGYSRVQGVGHSALELGLWLHVSDRDRVLAQIATDGHVSNIATKFVGADGLTRDILLSGSTLSIGGVACIAWAWRDISELRQLERARADSDRRYRTLFDSALDAIVIVSPLGVLLDINRFGSRTTGYTTDELIGKSVEKLFDPERLAKNPLRLENVKEFGAVRINRTIRRKDGSEIPAEILAGPLPDGSILAIVRDISERNRIQALLQHIACGISRVIGEPYFRSLVSNLAQELSADCCFIGEIPTEDPGKVRTLAYYADGAVAPNFEYPLEGSPCADVVARHGTICIPGGVAIQYPADLGLQRMAVEGYLGTSLFDSTDATIGVLVVLSRKTIKEIGLWTSVLEIFAARAAAEMERARAEKRILEIKASLEKRVAERTAALESTNRELESFSYSVSHDLRAPLRAIESFSAILLRECKEKLDAEDFSMLTRISQNALRMSQLIQDLLQFARAARGALASTKIDMRHLVERVVAEFEAGGDARAQISIGDLPPATGDAAVLRQVWQNLIGNALKFSRNAAQPTVRIEGEKRDGMVEYKVSDNGAGFDAKYADKLFGAFQRLHTTREFEGTGIGLAVAQRIVKRHGGSIAAEGAVGTGATFRFTLPA